MNEIGKYDIVARMDEVARKLGFKPMSEWTEAEKEAAEQKIVEAGRQHLQDLADARREAHIAQFCPPAMRHFDLEKFPGDKNALQRLMEWPRRTNKANGVWICGETRRGKTRALYAVLQQCLKYDPKVMDSAEFSSFARDAAMSKEGEDATIAPMVSRGIFAIDDLGKRMTKVGWETLFTVIDRRMNNALPTLFTANFKPRDIAKLLPDSLKDACISEPIIERIRESCIQVIL